MVSVEIYKIDRNNDTHLWEIDWSNLVVEVIRIILAYRAQHNRFCLCSL
jgi:hypothetical protein